MFEKFGEFDSAEELNKKAAELKSDVEEVKKLAVENGLEPEDAEDYCTGATGELATLLMAALGKLEAEEKDLKLTGILKDWSDEVKKTCTESESMARAVRKKGKSLAGFIAKTAESGYQNRAIVDKRIVSLLSGDIKKIVGSHEFSIGVPDKATRRKLMREYYLGKRVES